VSNLVDNALKYGAADGAAPQISITGAIEGGNVVITVSDRGPGIPPADRERAIERFVRLTRAAQARQRPGAQPRRRRHEAA
jgi:signal transduction histidine kinase